MGFRRRGTILKPANFPQIVGNIINLDNSGFDAVNFDAPVGAATFSFNSANLTVSGGNGTFNNYATYPYYTALEDGYIEIEYKMTSAIGGATYGVAFGWKSQNSVDQKSWFCYLVHSSGGLLGKCILDSTTYTEIGLNSLPVAQNDLFRVRLTRTATTYNVLATNLTQGGTSSVTLTCPTSYPIGTNVPNNTSKISIFPLGGTYTITSLKYYSNEYTLSDAMLIADSKGGYCASVLANRTKNLIVSDGFSCVLNWGSSDRTVEAVLRTSEYILFNPRKIFIDVGCNDIRNGVPAGTWQANFNTIYNTLTAANIEVWFITPSCEGGINTLQVKTFLDANFTRVIDMFTPTWLGGAVTNYDPTYIEADAIHLKDAGMNLKKSLIEAVI